MCNCNCEKDLTVKFKKVNNGRIPEYQTKGSAGADCYANINIEILPNEIKLIPLGFMIELPDGYEMQIRPRSGLALKKGITIINSPGTIDEDFRLEVGAIIINHGKESFNVRKGDRICQCLISKFEKPEFKIVSELSVTDRKGGFGSTGK